MNTIQFRDLGCLEYGEAWQIQEALMKQGLDVKARRHGAGADLATQEKIPNHFLLCSHPHVYTLGKSGHMENLLINDCRLRELDISFYKTNRGGDITYHGPGQIVGYPVLDLELFFTDLGRYMRSLEEVIIRTLSVFGIEAGRLIGATGVWLDSEVPGKARKVCAMGVRCSRWITIHGFALNVNTNLKYFDYIVPCGITDKSVTSMQKELGYEIPEQEVKDVLVKQFASVFEAEIIPSEMVSYP
jgi:lipoyl(octanoyl) transferase